MNENSLNGIERRNGMIKVDTKEYCQQCPNFIADANTIVLENLLGTKIGDTVIKCKNRDNCANIKKYLEAQT